ncbi:MAG: hypothetical protein JWO88_3728 [Frankiales bacterium]|nr:hypothetical protein [Frankiales bacterium]
MRAQFGTRQAGDTADSVVAVERPGLETLARREVRDGNGTRWQIREADARDVPGALGPYCLIFDAEVICRRVWIYPDAWAQLTVISLLGLMDRPTDD